MSPNLDRYPRSGAEKVGSLKAEAQADLLSDLQADSWGAKHLDLGVKDAHRGHGLAPERLKNVDLSAKQALVRVSARR